VEKSASASGFEGIAGFEMTDAVARGFERDGISTPTPVQSAAIGPILAGSHVVIESGTGTGKTLAYLLPLLQRLRQSPEGRVACFAPATELAIQTLRTVERYKEPSLNVCALVASSNQHQQQARLQKSTRLVVGTTGRILEMFAKRKLKGVTTMVLDEPEPILANKDAAFLREVLSRPQPQVQLIFAAATYGARAEQWILELMGNNVVRTQVEDNPLHSRITHSFLRVRDEAGKDLLLARFIQNNRCKRAIVFVNQPHLIRHLYRFLGEHSLRPVSVSQERSKQECKQALLDFAQSDARILLTTDEAATGLDMPEVPWVLHYELPNSAQAYVHRAGRTARAGHSGHSVALVSDQARAMLNRIASELKIEFLPFSS